jgi:hypothetical protein
MATAPSEITEADILSEIVAPGKPDLPADTARSMLELRFSQQAVEHMNVLAEKNRQDSLSPSERTALERYQRVGNFLNLLHAKARNSLARISND